MAARTIYRVVAAKTVISVDNCRFIALNERIAQQRKTDNNFPTLITIIIFTIYIFCICTRSSKRGDIELVSAESKPRRVNSAFPFGLGTRVKHL